MHLLEHFITRMKGSWNEARLLSGEYRSRHFSAHWRYQDQRGRLWKKQQGQREESSLRDPEDPE